MASITTALNRIKQQPLSDILDAQCIQEVFAEHGYQWRNRILGPAQTIELFIRQIIQGNESCGHVRQMAGGTFTAGAYCMARSRLPLQAFCTLCRRVWQELYAEHEPAAALWHGHRTFHLDGTSFSMPDTPALQQTFGQPGGQKPGCGFPAAHLLMAFDAPTGMVTEAIPAPLRTHDLRNVPWIHQCLGKGDILIGDKAFGSWAHLALLEAQEMHGLFPLHQRRKIKGSRDRLECWPKPEQKPAWLTQQQYDALPEELTVRVICRKIVRRGFRTRTIHLVTTLRDRQTYRAKELVELGRSRWSVELNIRHLKTTLGMDVLKCKTVDGVLKELAVFLLVYNMVRAIMLNASASQGVPVDRISFADALAWLRCTHLAGALIILRVNPLRVGRIEPRAIKRRLKEYDLMTRPRGKMRNALKNSRKAA